jgi:hypothetical protein
MPQELPASPSQSRTRECPLLIPGTHRPLHIRILTGYGILLVGTSARRQSLEHDVLCWLQLTERSEEIIEATLLANQK